MQKAWFFAKALNKIFGSMMLNPWAACIPNRRADPIILDLNGNGVADTVSRTQGVYYDLNHNGFAERTGWVGSGDGLLVWDRNGNGAIDNGGELFGDSALKQDGTTAANGFEILASYDDNHDGKIDQQDALWGQLGVWVDSNGDGVTDVGELHSLESLGIASLNAGTVDMGSGADATGNDSRFVGSYTKTDGTIAKAVDVFFDTDTSDSVATSWVATTPEIDALPDLQGQGNLYSLHQAMARDASGTLQSLVTQFTQATTIAARNALMEQILLNWAGTASVDPDSRNSYGAQIDARHLATLEAFMGSSYQQMSGAGPNDPTASEVDQLTTGYTMLFERQYAELAAQTFMKRYYNEIQIAFDANGIHFDFTAALADLFSPASLTHDNVVEFYRTVFACGMTSELVDYNGMLSQLATQAPQYSAEVNSLVAVYYQPVRAVTFSNGGSALIGSLGDDVLGVNSACVDSVVYGNAGNDTINSWGRGAQIYGGDGDDTINLYCGTNALFYGGDGDDTVYLYSYGLNGMVIDGGAGTNTLKTSSQDISAATILNMQTLDLGYVGVTMTADQFNGFDSITAGEAWAEARITASGAGTYDLTTKATTGHLDLQASSDGNVLIGNAETRYIYGGYGDDTLYAGPNATTLDGRWGTNTLYGGAGDDTFYVEGLGDQIYGGGGDDTVYLYSYGLNGTVMDGGTGTNTLQTSGQDISAATILNMQALDLGYVGVTMTADQFNGFDSITAGGTWAEARISASGAGTYDLTTKATTGHLDLRASDAGNVLIGNAETRYVYGGAGNDVLGGADNAELYGNGGTDTYLFGRGSGAERVINSGGAEAKGELDIASGVSSNQVWFERVDSNGAVSATGNNLCIDILGTSDRMTVENWFNQATPGAQLAEIKASDESLMIDTQFALLVQAMATYGAEHSAFNPTTATQMPTDSSLQTALAAAWHS